MSAFVESGHLDVGPPLNEPSLQLLNGQEKFHNLPANHLTLRFACRLYLCANKGCRSSSIFLLCPPDHRMLITQNFPVTRPRNKNRQKLLCFPRRTGSGRWRVRFDAEALPATLRRRCRKSHSLHTTKIQNKIVKISANCLKGGL